MWSPQPAEGAFHLSNYTQASSGVVVATVLQGPDCVIYSFGSNGDVTFEEALVGLTNAQCQVHVFDFTLSPDLAQKVRSVNGVTLHEYGIGAEDKHVVEPYQFGAWAVNEYDIKCLSTIMTELGHSWIDVLKMDVEGAEYDVLNAVMSHFGSLGLPVPITQAQIEFHHWPEHPSAHQLLHTLTAVEKAGFRAFHQEFNYNGEAWNFIEYAYLHVSNDGAVIGPFRSIAADNDIQEADLVSNQSGQHFW